MAVYDYLVQKIYVLLRFLILLIYRHVSFCIEIFLYQRNNFTFIND